MSSWLFSVVAIRDNCVKQNEKAAKCIIIYLFLLGSIPCAADYSWTPVSADVRLYKHLQGVRRRGASNASRVVEIADALIAIIS